MYSLLCAPGAVSRHLENSVPQRRLVSLPLSQFLRIVGSVFKGVAAPPLAGYRDFWVLVASLSRLEDI